MSDILPLEAALEARAKTDEDAKAFWHHYNSVKIYLAKEYYRWIQANLPFFTDHGEQHIQSVIQVASLLLSKHLNPDGKSQLSSLDIFLILSGILWHDVGNVYNRSEHSQLVAEMTEKIKTLIFPTLQIHRLVDEISKAHSGKKGLNIPRLDEYCATSNQNYEVNPRALAAIVRFADEVSENHSRISRALLPKIPDENRIYWEYANCISASTPEPERFRVVVTVEIQRDKAIGKFICHEFPNRVNGTGQIPLMEYILSRLEKINNERAYCAPQFSRYVSIQEIIARFTILHGTERVNNYDMLQVVFGDCGLSQDSYPKIQIFEEFFRCYPNWKPENLKEALH